MIALAHIDWRPHSPAVIHPPPLPVQVANRYSVYPRWPENGDDWIHPDDVNTVRRLIPGDRVFRRHRPRREYMRLTYGPIAFNVKPSLCTVIEGDGLNIGDQVEVLSRMGKNLSGLAVIEEMRWDKTRRCICYRVRRGEQVSSNRYTIEDLRPAPRLTSLSAAEE